MNQIIIFIDNINEQVGKIAAWSTSLLVWLICANVLMRYIFNTSFIWFGELETYFFAISFLLTGAYAFKHNSHVRVDLFYDKWSPKRKALVNLFGGILILIPWCTIAFWYCWEYAYKAFKVGEKSNQPGGLPALYILKFIIVFGFALLLLQAISNILKSIQTIKSNN